jgi:hypothetical protein
MADNHKVDSSSLSSPIFRGGYMNWISNVIGFFIVLALIGIGIVVVLPIIAILCCFDTNPDTIDCVYPGDKYTHFRQILRERKNIR